MKPHKDAPNAWLYPLPTLRLPLLVWQQVMAYTCLCPLEVNGFGYITHHSALLRVSEVFILDQTVTTASAEVHELTLARHLTNMMNSSIPTSRLRFQWHSHCWGDTYCSHVDEDNIGVLGANAPWLVSLVVNKFGERYAQLNTFGEFPVSAEIPVEIDCPPGSAELFAACRSDLAGKVKDANDRPIEPIKLQPSTPLTD